MNLPTANAPHRRMAVRILLVAIAIAALAGMLLLILAPRRAAVTWLTPGAPLQQPMVPPGPLQTLKFRLQRLADPLWQKIIAARTPVVIDAQVIAVPNGTNSFGEITSAPTSIREGVRVWILPADQWKRLAEQLKTAPHAELLGNMRMQTIERMQSQMALAGRALVDGKPVAVGTELRFFTRGGKHDVRLAVIAEITEQLHQFTASARTVPVTNSVLQTNLSAALQASVPDGGALVLARETANPLNGRMLWLIVSPAQLKPPRQPAKP